MHNYISLRHTVKGYYTSSYDNNGYGNKNEKTTDRSRERENINAGTVPKEKSGKIAA